MEQPTVCLYCDGEGNSKAGGACGFCESGRPLDTKEMWDRSWGGLFRRMTGLAEDAAIAARIRERMANDDGTRYTLDEVAEMFGVDLDRP
jgi:hypothetical protein